MELAALKTTENLLESSWLTGELVQAGVAACGKADSFPKALHITPTSRLIPSHWRSLYTGFSLMTITTMYDGYQFTSMI